MMRKELSKQNNVRSSFIGVFVRFGTKTNYHGFPEKTVLLKDIKDNQNNIVCDHLWFNHTKQFQALGEIQPKTLISFNARVKEYVKGYINRDKFIDDSTIDYKLSHPTQVRKVNSEGS